MREDRLLHRLVNHLRRSYRNASITSKFFIIYLLVLIIPAICLMALMITYLSNSTKSQAYEQAKIQLTLTHDKLNDRLTAAENVSTICLGQHEFLDFISGDMRGNGLQLIKFKNKDFRQMESIVRSNPLVDQVSFYVSNPNLYEIWHLIYDYDIRFPDKTYGNNLANTGATWELFSLSGQSSLSYYRNVPLVWGTQKLTTVLEVRISHDRLLRELNLASGDSPFYLLSPDGEWLSANGDMMASVTAISTDQLVPNQTLQQFSSEDREIFAIYNRKLRTYLITIVDNGPLLQPIRSLYPIIGLATIFLLFILLIALRQLTKRMFRRVDRLQASMSEVSRGNMSVKVHTGLLDGEKGDVIDALAENYNQMLDEIGRLMEEAVDRELVAKNAQLHALQNQIQSHFLYNALESIRMLAVEEKQEQISDALVTLGQLMRYSLRWRSDIVELHVELHHIQNYISFINFMGENCYTLKITVSEQYFNYEIPKMSIQPLVENVVQHANKNGEAITIDISAEPQADHLLLCVRDNGAGIPAPELQALRRRLYGDKPQLQTETGLGLENVHRRLLLQYGPGHGLQITSEVGQYTEVCLYLPRVDREMGGW